MSKYIIEIKPEYEDKFKGVMILGAENSNLYVDSNTVDELEELTADYINEHFGDLQDTAYQKGINDGSLDVKQRVEGAYQRGLDDAWEAARKIAEMWETIDNDELLGIFGLTAKIGESTIGTLFKKQTAAEAIEKLKAYEEKQKADDKIEVGDEVEWDNDFTGDRFIVTRIYQPYGKKEQCDGIDDDGDVYRAVLIESLVKTGRHFDIASILEEMKHETIHRKDRC